MRSKILICIFALVFTVPVLGQELLPFVENYTKSDYNGDNQVWNVVQGSDNAMYFANNHYLLRYNGVSWERTYCPIKLSSVRFMPKAIAFTAVHIKSLAIGSASTER